MEKEENQTFVEYAGFWIRVGASLIDGLVLFVPAGLNILNLLYWKSLPLCAFLHLAIMGYKPFMEWRYGATLGKMALGIRVTNYYLGPIRFQDAFVRYVPWAFGQVVTLFSYVSLFQYRDFFEISTLQELSPLLNEAMPASISTFTSFFLLTSCLIVAMNPKRQGLHDLMAKTYCIYKR